VLQLEFSDRYHLWSALIHQRADRHFVPTETVLPLGSETPVQVHLPDLPIHIVMTGKVVGLRPASDKFPAGVYLQFSDGEIEKCRSYLGLRKQPDRPFLGRRSARVDCALPVRIVNPPTPQPFVTQNLSSSGALVQCNLTLHLGQQVDLALTLDDAAVVELAAEVIWTQHSAGLVGFSFIDVPEAVQPRILGALERLTTLEKARSRVPTVVVVEDEASILTLLGETLRQHGYETLLVNNSEEAIAVIRKARPQLVLMDVLMPGIDGKDLCKKMRSDVEMASIPVVLVSGMIRESLHSVAAECGASDYLLKPFPMSELNALVRKYAGQPGVTSS